jgi:hypothetical protein
MVITKAVRETVRERRKADADWNGVRVPASIPYLEGLLSAQRDLYDIDELLSEISGEYARAEMFDQQLETARRRAINLPDDTLVQIELARRLSYSAAASASYADESKNIIARAVELARQQNEWVRSALSEQAWIGIRINDPSEFASAMEALIQDVASGRKFAIDARLYPEIIDEIPAGFCSDDLIERYRLALYPKA